MNLILRVINANEKEMQWNQLLFSEDASKMLNYNG